MPDQQVLRSIRTGRSSSATADAGCYACNRPRARWRPWSPKSPALKPLVFTNNASIATDGSVYFSDSSTKFSIHNYTGDLLEGRATGRLLRWSPTEGVEVVLDGLLVSPMGWRCRRTRASRWSPRPPDIAFANCTCRAHLRVRPKSCSTTSRACRTTSPSARADPLDRLPEHAQQTPGQVAAACRRHPPGRLGDAGETVTEAVESDPRDRRNW